MDIPQGSAGGGGSGDGIFDMEQAKKSISGLLLVTSSTQVICARREDGRRGAILVRLFAMVSTSPDGTGQLAKIGASMVI